MSPSATILLTAVEVAVLLNVPVKRVYTLPIPKRVLGKRTYRWRESDVYAYIEDSAAPVAAASPDIPSTATWARPAKEPRNWRQALEVPKPVAKPSVREKPQALAELFDDDNDLPF